MLNGVLAVLGCCFFVWLMYYTIKNNKAAFSMENMNRSLTTLGILALILISVVGLMIFLLRQGL